MLRINSLIRRIDLFSIKLFLVVVEEGQIGRAAEKEHIAASAATKRIHDLEEEVGMELFIRTAKGIAPTQAGLVFAKFAGKVMESIDDLRFDIASISEGVSGSIEIAAPNLMISRFLPKILAEFRERFPKVVLQLRDQTNFDVIQSLLTGKVDLAVFIHPVETEFDDIEWFEWRRDRLVLVVPADHAFSERASISIEELLNEDLIGFSDKTALMTSLYHAARQIGREAHIKFRVSSVEAACSMVSAGLGVALAPSRIGLDDLGDRLALVDIDGEWALRTYCIGKRLGKDLSPSAKEFVEHIIPGARFRSRKHSESEKVA